VRSWVRLPSTFDTGPTTIINCRKTSHTWPSWQLTPHHVLWLPPYAVEHTGVKPHSFPGLVKACCRNKPSLCVASAVLVSPARETQSQDLRTQHVVIAWQRVPAWPGP
jgi:hypothetical protein